MDQLPKVALSIRQPWTFAITNGGKDIENRQWRTRFRGPVLIHASKGLTQAEIGDFTDFVRAAGLIGPWLTDVGMEAIHRGGIVGVAEIVDCVEDHPSPWFMGSYGFVLRNARPLPFMPCKGALGFFKAEYCSAEVAR